MPATGTPTPAALPEAPHGDPQQRPHLRDVVRRTAVSLVVACAIPAVVFYTCFRVSGVWTAIIAALVWSYGAIAWRALTGRRTSGLLLISAVVMTARTLVAVTTDSTFVYFLQPILTDAVIAAVFLGSLRTARPMVARLAGDFYPMDGELAVRPRIQRLFRHLTAMWALLCLGKAVFVLWLLLSQSLETFVLAKSVAVLLVNVTAIAVTIAAAAAVGRREGLLPARLAPA